MRRRDFIARLSGAAAAWPLAARAQQSGRARRVGVLMAITEDDPQSKARLAALAQGLQQLGWIIGQNVQVDYRWGGGNIGNLRKFAAELIALEPDVILAHSSTAVEPLLEGSRTIPIVFTTVSDPVGAGYVENLARPGGNATGFINFEYAIGGKWLELLKEIEPRVKRAAVFRDSAIAAGPGQFGAIQSVASSFGVELSAYGVRDGAEIERAIAAFARAPEGGLIVTASALAAVHRDLIIELAARNKLPAIYYERNYVAAGGLISYGPNFVDQFRQAASYVDRILRGDKPANLPVQTPTRYELAINLKTAKALGITMPPSLMARADEVIE